MRILVAPLVSPIETAGPTQRAVALAQAFGRAGHTVAFCAAENSSTTDSIWWARSPPYILFTHLRGVVHRAAFPAGIEDVYGCHCEPDLIDTQCAEAKDTQSKKS